MRPRFVSSSSRMIVVARALLVALAAAAVVTGFVVTRKSAPQPAASNVVFVCPMHPAVTSATPGECPICRMALERQAAAAGTAGKAAEPASLTLPRGMRLAGFDAVSRVKQFESTFAMRAWAWAESREVGVALYPRDQAAMLQPGEDGLFEPQSVRFRIDNRAGAALEPKEIGSIKFALRLRTGLVVRESAVIQSPEGPYVLIASEDRKTFTKRPVQIGSTLYEYADLLGGAREDEYAVAQHTFVLDTERRLGRRAAP